MLTDLNYLCQKSLYLLIVNYNSSDLVMRLIQSLEQNNWQDYQVVIVNNSAQDKQIFSLENDLIKIIETESNLGFGKACNLGLNWIAERDQKAIIWLINPDTYFDSDQLDSTMSPLKLAIALFELYPQLSILGTIVCNAQGEITSAGGNFTPGTGSLSVITLLPEDITDNYLKTDWVSGCSLLINLANFEVCPNFDPRYFLYYEDLDFCLRYGQQGHQIAVTHLIKVIHDTSSITNRNIKQKYQHITHSYLIHMEKYSNLPLFILTNIRMSLNTLRLILFKPQQGIGKLIGIISYWHGRVANLRASSF